MPIVGSKTAGTGYINLSKILNRGLGGSNMGSSLAHGIQQAGQTAQEAHEKEKKDFEQDSSTAMGAVTGANATLHGTPQTTTISFKPPSNPQPRPPSGSSRYAYTPGQYTPTQVTTTTPSTSFIDRAASGTLTDPNEIKQATDLISKINQGYTGPMGVSGLGQSAASKAVAMSKQGVGGLLQGKYGTKAGYNPALRRFDEAVVRRSPEFENIRQAQTSVSGAGEAYNRLAGYAKDRASQLASEAGGIKEKVQGEIGGKLTDINTAIDTKLGTVKQEADTTATRIQDKIKKGNWSAEDPDIKLLVDSGIDLGMIANGNITKDQIAGFITSNSGDIERSDVMTPAQLNALRALTTLSGKEYKDSDFGVTDPTKVGQAGSPLAINTGLPSLGEGTQSSIKTIEGKYSSTLSTGKKAVQDAIAIGQNLGVEYSPGSDYSALLGNASATAANQAQKIAEKYATADDPGGVYAYNRMSPEDKAAYSKLMQKSESLRNARDKFISAANPYQQQLMAAQQEMQPFMSGGGKFRTLADVLGLPVPTSATQNFLSDYDLNNLMLGFQSPTTNKKTPGSSLTGTSKG